jgi:hypothetical protein
VHNRKDRMTTHDLEALAVAAPETLSADDLVDG